jgi:hypothetical protein
MSPRHACLTLLAGIHLFLVACGASGNPLGSEESLGYKWRRLYGELSGADNRYGFFAPAVGYQLRTVFVLEDKDGGTWSDIHERGPNAECNLRLGGLTDAAWAQGNVDRTQLHSWAAAALGRHPRAVAVEVKIEAYQMPSMAQYRLGVRPHWETIYTANYTREDADGADRE